MKRILAWVLCLGMILPLGVRNVRAEEGTEDNGSVHSNKTVIQDENGNMEIQIDAWTEGVTTFTPLEVVVIVDQSGSMMDRIDTADNYYRPSEFYNNPDFMGKGETYDGYYAAVTKRTNETGADGHGDSLEDATHVLTLLKYDKEQGWLFCEPDHLTETGYDGMGCVHHMAQYESRAWTSVYDTTNSNFNDDDSTKIYKTRYGGIVDSLQLFVDQIAPIPNVKVAFTTFADEGSKYDGTWLFLNDGSRKGMGELTDADYQNAFVSLNQSRSIVDKIILSLEPTHPNTNTHLGLQMAEKVLRENENTDHANRVVVLFTDGLASNQDTCIQVAKEIKDPEGCNTTVYSVGLGEFEGNFLQRISSDYPTATSMNSPASPTSSDHYIQAIDSKSLETTFQSLGEKFYKDSVALSKDAIVKDVITPYFEIAGAADSNAITVYQVPCTGKDASGNAIFAELAESMKLDKEKITVTVSEREENGATYTDVDVKGYDFEGNSVNKDEPAGYKLVIRIPIQARSEFLGGNHVDTNAPGSGIYPAGATRPVEELDIPQVNVSVKDEIVKALAVNAHAGSYYLEAVDLKDLADMVNVSVENIKLDLSRDDLGLEDWQANYVNIQVELRDAEGNKLEGGLLNIDGDTQYQIFLKVWPKYDEAGNPFPEPDDSIGASETGWIYVYYPLIQFGDTSLYYGQEIPDYNNYQKIEVQWVTKGEYEDGDYITDKDVIMIGDTPEVYFYIDPIDSALTEHTGAVDDYVGKYGKYMGKTDIAMNVRVYLKNQQDPSENAFHHTYFTHQSCIRSDRHSIEIPPHEIGSRDFNKIYWLPEFFLHPQFCDLTIEKEGGADDETYLFNVYKDGALYTQASIRGNGWVTIQELPVGTYTVEELTDWTWRYRPKSNSIQVTLSPENEKSIVTFENDRKIENWLNGFSSAVKNIFGIANATDDNG